jgi:hypothetical protein
VTRPPLARPHLLGVTPGARTRREHQIDQHEGQEEYKVQ